MITTGQAAWWAHCWLTEPSSSPAKPPRPREPTTRSSASRDSSTSTDPARALDYPALDLYVARVRDGLGNVASSAASAALRRLSRSQPGIA